LFPPNNMCYALLQEAHGQILNTLIIPLIEPSYLILIQRRNSEQTKQRNYFVNKDYKTSCV
jgi:hypothetical protein